MIKNDDSERKVNKNAMEIKYINLDITTHVSTNLIPVLVCKHFRIIPPPSICSIPSSAPAFDWLLLNIIEDIDFNE